MTQPQSETSASQMAIDILNAVQQGWDPLVGTPEFDGMTVAELRQLDKHGRYWVDGEVTDEDAYEKLYTAHFAAVSFLSAKQPAAPPVV